MTRFAAAPARTRVVHRLSGPKRVRALDAVTSLFGRRRHPVACRCSCATPWRWMPASTTAPLNDVPNRVGRRPRGERGPHPGVAGGRRVRGGEARRRGDRGRRARWAADHGGCRGGGRQQQGAGGDGAEGGAGGAGGLWQAHGGPSWRSSGTAGAPARPGTRVIACGAWCPANGSSGSGRALRGDRAPVTGGGPASRSPTPRILQRLVASLLCADPVLPGRTFGRCRRTVLRHPYTERPPHETESPQSSRKREAGCSYRPDRAPPRRSVRWRARHGGERLRSGDPDVPGQPSRLPQPRLHHRRGVQRAPGRDRHGDRDPAIAGRQGRRLGHECGLRR